MIPTFHDYSLEPKITKCGDLLYFEINWPLKEKVSHLYLKNWGEMWMFKKHNPTLLNNLKKYFHVICLKVIPKLFKMKCLILCDELLYSFMTITIEYICKPQDFYLVDNNNSIILHCVGHNIPPIEIRISENLGETRVSLVSSDEPEPSWLEP